MIILDLFCGVGGATKGMMDAGHTVIGVDINPQPEYPGFFIQGDVFELDLPFDMVDLTWASPPCQAASSLTKGTLAQYGKEYPQLIPDTRALLEESGLPYIIENVVGAPLRRDLRLCGLMFGLPLFRHRIFEIEGWEVPYIAHPSHAGHRVAGTSHGVKYPGDIVAVYGGGMGNDSHGSIESWRAAMGITWTRNRRSISEAIPPAYSRFILDGHDRLS